MDKKIILICMTIFVAAIYITAALYIKSDSDNQILQINQEIIRANARKQDLDRQIISLETANRMLADQINAKSAATTTTTSTTTSTTTTTSITQGGQVPQTSTTVKPTTVKTTTTSSSVKTTSTRKTTTTVRTAAS